MKACGCRQGPSPLASRAPARRFPRPSGAAPTPSCRGGRSRTPWRSRPAWRCKRLRGCVRDVHRLDPAGVASFNRTSWAVSRNCWVVEPWSAIEPRAARSRRSGCGRLVIAAKSLAPRGLIPERFWRRGNGEGRALPLRLPTPDVRAPRNPAVGAVVSLVPRGRPWYHFRACFFRVTYSH